MTDREAPHVNKQKILIIDAMHESIVPLLEKQGFSVDHRPAIQRQEILAAISSCDGLIVRSKTPIDKELLANARRLKFIARAGSGVDMLDVAELKRRKVSILNAAEGNRDALGEHALGMLLCVAGKISLADQSIRRMIWDRERHRGFEIKNKTVGLIGYGQMGSAFAEKLSGLGCRVIAYDKYKSGFSSSIVREADMQEIYAETDILSFHVPLTSETRHLVNEDYIKQFRKKLVVLNTSRGEVLPLSTLLKQIDTGKVSFAALDVLENEKLNTLTPEQKQQFNKLIKSDKVLLTPHVAGWTFESYERINEVLANKISMLSLASFG